MGAYKRVVMRTPDNFRERTKRETDSIKLLHRKVLCQQDEIGNTVFLSVACTPNQMNPISINEQVLLKIVDV